MQIVLYSGSYCPYSHRCRIVLKEKQMESSVEIHDVDLNRKPEELSYYNPYNQVPVFVDRDVRLYESNVINEYLNDRFPHPQLMPVDIMTRAKMRLMMTVLDKEMFKYVDILEKRGAKKARKEDARQGIIEDLHRLMPLIARGDKYFMGPEFTLIDAALAPLLWRLDHYGISLPARAWPISKYAERLFSREAFSSSLTSIERAMRK